jgi:phenylalanyl-tRNA synthetase alpha chain
MNNRSLFSNIPSSIESKLDKNLHLNPSHPIGIIKDLVHNYFDSLERNFEKYDNFKPIVTVENNFDRLLIPRTHPARSKSDTYYVDEDNVLRTHTSAHQNELLSRGVTSFLVSGDVYRKDEIDSTHYPVFHQMEGVWIDTQETMTETEIGEDLIKTLKGLCNHLFPDCPVRVSDDYFPFTNPSYQMDVFYGDRWIEILGCGVVEQQIIKNCSKENPGLISSIDSTMTDVKKGWAFGIGLDRLAMILFEIPDIRLLWVDSDKFLKQFKPNTIVKFKPYSVLPTICKDVSFYIPGSEVLEIQAMNDSTGSLSVKMEDVEKYTDKKSGIVRIWTRENDMYESIRESANNLYPDIVEKVEMFDQFYNNKLSKLSRAYRIHYSAPDPEMNDPGKLTQIVNQLHANISKDLNKNLNVEIR